MAEFDYRPTQCRKTYRMVVVRKNLSVEKGEHRLFDEVRFYAESRIMPSSSAKCGGSLARSVM